MNGGVQRVDIAEGLMGKMMALQIEPVRSMSLSSGAYFASHSTVSQGLAARATRDALLVWIGP